MLLAFSDGVVETADATGSFLDENDPTWLVAGNLGLPMGELTDSAVARFVARFGAGIADDITIVCARLP